MMSSSFIIIFFSFRILIEILPSHSTMLSSRLEKENQVPALFAFGDSFLDNGNNVYLNNPDVDFEFLPYGVDFPEGPTGRLTNGLNPADILGELLGITGFLPAALDPAAKGERILAGVNYASGGSGILDGTDPSKCISLSQQIKLFQRKTLPDLRSQLNKNGISNFVSKSMFVFSAGGNDCYWLCAKSNGSGQCLSEDFLLSLLGNYTQQLKKLHRSGARKFVLISLQPLGCIPFARVKGECSERLNQAALLFNARLRSNIHHMKQAMPGSHFVVVDTYNIIRNIMDDPAPKGFKVVNESCCPLSAATQWQMCERGRRPCMDRDTCLYFDGAHPTEASYRRLTEKAFFSDLAEEVYPYNVGDLANLRLEPPSGSELFV